ncbi:MAG: 23S rRNA (adenine1618-N6)-methyltransferase [Algoriphagus sp.]|jgi:23S rRNA (adenine1618-N6)-methyltransferase|tara:strand:- start:610 stop:1569 length:960 start_codon:yes stop_codon:yes gene_type:complete
MKSSKKSKTETSLHPRNLHQGTYDLEALIKSSPELKRYVFVNTYGNQTLDFSDPDGIKSLNRALLIHFYHIKTWDIPIDFLCPPIPGRSDYMHYVADLLAESNLNKIPSGPSVSVLDIGAGANLIYPILGHASYGWRFVGSELNHQAIQSAEMILQSNPHLLSEISIRKQSDPKNILKGIIHPLEFFDLTICNPPFHHSAEEARQGTLRKVKNLHRKTDAKPALNFGGQADELWCAGGELEFIKEMIRESANFRSQVLWFSSLVAKSEHLKLLQVEVKKAGAFEQKVIEMAQGNKKSRLIAWTFLTKSQQEVWSKKRWA